MKKFFILSVAFLNLIITCKLFAQDTANNEKLLIKIDKKIEKIIKDKNLRKEVDIEFLNFEVQSSKNNIQDLQNISNSLDLILARDRGTVCAC